MRSLSSAATRPTTPLITTVCITPTHQLQVSKQQQRELEMGLGSIALSLGKEHLGQRQAAVEAAGRANEERAVQLQRMEEEVAAAAQAANDARQHQLQQEEERAAALRARNLDLAARLQQKEAALVQQQGVSQARRWCSAWDL